MSIFRPVLDQDLIARVLELKPKYMTATVFLNSMLEDAYKSRCKELKYMALYTHKDKELDKKGLEGKEQKEKINKKEKQEKIIPEDLQHLQTLIDDFWKVKKGSKSIQAWKQQITEYRKFIQKYGEQILKDQLEAGILAGTWKGCTIKNYETISKINNKGFIEENKPHPNQKIVKFDNDGFLI